MDALAPPPLPPRMPMAPPRGGQDDAAQLRLLSVLHYVMAGFTALFSLFPVIYLVLGIAVLSGAMPVDSNTASSPGEVQLMGWVFTGLGAVFFVGMLGMAGLLGYAGRCLAREQRHTLCMVAAGVCCMFMPLGTILGVFTLVTLTRTSVRERFAHGATPPPSTP
ncbi:hypothetical protein SOM22_12465 [Stenotrophomonas rhizophila]|uniref:hypothetical protein n=1 Tax=Stenotrophomonas rhizophila TaxID=216778 RepID=UPI002A6B0D50|nr:hypothetical protein [Stenotrophomonas rhizophila]MDY0955395.1 hypothetical protein [Stenotrophomonas rhizophila]